MRVRKLIGITGILIFFSFLLSPIAFCADIKIGVVNFQKILETSEAGKSAKNQLVAEGQRMEADLKKKGDEINALQKQLESDGGVMSKEAREEKKWELDRKVNDAKSTKKKYDSQIQELQGSLVNQIRQGLISIIKNYGQKEGYSLIIEDLGVVYAPQGSDITEKIIKIYNEQNGQQGKKN